MKLNKNFKAVLSNVDLIITAVLYGVLIIVMTFYPKASWIQMAFGALVLILIQALLRLKNKGQESVLDEINKKIDSLSKNK